MGFGGGGGVAEEHGLQLCPTSLFRAFLRQEVMKSVLTWTGGWSCASWVSCLNWTPREGGKEKAEEK